MSVRFAWLRRPIVSQQPLCAMDDHPMQRWRRRRWAALSTGILLCLLSVFAAQAQRGLPSEAASVPNAPVLINAGFECTQGYGPQPGIDGLVPAGWTAALISGYPKLNSTRLEFSDTHSCDGSGFIERLEGIDSLAFLSQDIETPPDPGKPFDAVVYQQIAVMPGAGYGLSGWMVSLCGGSNNNPPDHPNDCPTTEGYYMSKMLGIDPTGGTDPMAPSVIWVEDRRNFTESRWANLRLGATAQSATMTVFARIRSPFRWHGNHAFVDALSIMRSPTASFVGLPLVAAGPQVIVQWTGSLGPDIPSIPGGNYQLLYDVQYRLAGQADWTDWQMNQPAGQAVFATNSCGPTVTVDFRVRARAEQPEGVPGASPNHRYPSDWSEPSSVVFLNGATCTPRAYLPLVLK